MDRGLRSSARQEIDQILRDDRPGQRAHDPRGGELPRLLGPRRRAPSATSTGKPQPFLTPNEVEALSIRRGSLSEKERREIESHVTHTYHFLSEIPWTSEFRRVPEIAYAHHEKLDGTGYPRQVSRRQDIPIQSRMMTISDIFDALVAWDRPYKKSVPVEQGARHPRATRREHGKLDGDLLDVFIEAKVYETNDAVRRPSGGRADR